MHVIKKRVMRKEIGQNIGSDDDDQSEATKTERDALVNDLPWILKMWKEWVRTKKQWLKTTLFKTTEQGK